MHPHLYHAARGSRSTNAVRSYHRSTKVHSSSLLAECALSEELIAERRLSRTIAAAKATKASRKGSVAPSVTRPPGISPRHAPLFARESKAGRWLFDGVVENSAWRAPKYRLRESYEDLSPLSSEGFNPFVSCTGTSKVIQRLPSSSGFDTETTAPSVWSTNSLPLATSSRAELLRSNARLNHTVESATPLDDIAEESGAVHMSTDQRLHKGGNDKAHPVQELDAVQQAMAEDLVSKVSDPSTSMHHHDLETALLRIGKRRLLQLGLPTEFVESSANHQDAIGTGLETLIVIVQRLPTTLDIGPLIDTLDRFQMLQHLDKIDVARLRSIMRQTSTDDSRTLQRSRHDILQKVIQWRGAKKHDRERWRVHTRRFRLSLALARFSGAMPSEKEYLAFMKSCLKASCYQELELVFHHFVEHREQLLQQPSEMVYREFIKGLVRQGHMDHAQEVFNSMKHNKLTPSVVTFGVMLDGFGRQMDLRRMGQTLKALLATGALPTLEIYTSLMGNYIRAGQLEKAYDIYRQLLARSDLVLDRQSRNVVENLARLRSSQSDGSSLLFKETLGAAGVLQPTADFASTEFPNLERLNQVIRINHRLKRYIDAMNMPMFVKTFKEFGSQDLRPNTTTFNILLDALANTGELDDGLQVLEHMKRTREGLPDAITYSTLIRSAVSKGRADLGWTLYDEMRRQSITPSLHTYVSLIELVGLDPKSKLGRTVVKNHFIAGRQHIRFPVKAAVEDQVGLNFAGVLYNQLCNQGFQPNAYIFGSLLDLTIRGGYMQLAQHVYLEMLYKKVEPNTAIMTNLIKGFAIQRDFESGWKVWRNMVETNIPRNAITYHQLIRLCERSLPNPIMMAEILDNPSPADDSSSTNQTDRPKTKKKKNARQGLDTSAGDKQEHLENTTRIPLAIWTEIRDQMRADRVDWSRVQQFRKRTVQRTIWRPIAKEASPVMAYSPLPEDLGDRDSVESGLGRVVLHQQVHAMDNESASHNSTTGTGLFASTRTELEYEQDDPPTIASSPGQRFDVQGHRPSEPSPMIKEIFTGGGDMYEPHRAPPAGMALKWCDSVKRPLMKKDLAARTDEE
ncbi:hypothetical protein BGZ70_001383 [Mortierella alpina]|uniref:Uncharacterized protein n=1 Tax=Mortierella alpina TaxID=64518 RepID=A0A9P6LY14_MORAP|nr:hypothetical protein BGZ70_001383 [Mortierella alpina]